MDNQGVKYGVFAAVAGIAVYLIAYLMGGFFHWSLGFVGLAIMILAMMQAGKETRELNGGFASWQEILRPTFLAGVIVSVFSTVFQYLMYNFVDTDLISQAKEKSVEAVEKMGGFLGEEGTEVAVEALENQDFGLNASQAFLTILVSIIFYFIVAAIISLIVKRNRPEGESV